jgi:hypothetical protein
MLWDGLKQDNGGADGDRTHDLRIANATLSQLSYRPTYRFAGQAAARGARMIAWRSGNAKPCKTSVVRQFEILPPFTLILRQARDWVRLRRIEG